MHQSFPPNHRPSYYPLDTKAENDNPKSIGDPAKWKRALGADAAAVGSAAIAAALIYANRRQAGSEVSTKPRRPLETD